MSKCRSCQKCGCPKSVHDSEYMYDISGALVPGFCNLCLRCLRFRDQRTEPRPRRVQTIINRRFV